MRRNTENTDKTKNEGNSNEMFLQRISILSTLLSFLSLIISCADSGIIEGGKFSGGQKTSVHAFYLYDYISKDKVKEHALTIINESKNLSASFYFSHNSNVPTQSLRLSKNFQDAIDIMVQYHHSLKYVSFKDETGQISFVDCKDEPDNKLCSGNNY